MNSASRRRIAWFLFTALLPLFGLGWMFGPGAWLTPLVESRALFPTATGGVLLVVLATCTTTDLAWRKIYNWTTYPTFLLALAVNLPADLWFSPELQQRLGVAGPLSCLFGAGLGFLGMLIAYNLSGGGAGDVKLACALGAWLGPQYTIHLLVYTYAVGAIVLLSVSIWRSGPGHVLGGLCRRIGSFLLPRWITPPSEEQALTLRQVVPMSPFFAVAGLAVLLGWTPS